MAYCSQAQKKIVQPRIKELLKKYGLRGRLGVRHHMTIELRIASGALDFIGEYLHAGENIKREYITDAKPRHFKCNKIAKFLKEARDILNEGNHDNSDIQTDYFDVGWYTSIDIGAYDKPYKFTPALK